MTDSDATPAPLDRPRATTPETDDIDSRAATVARAELLAEMIDLHLASMSDAERDEMLQSHLAAARGPRKNAELVARMMDDLLAIRRARQCPPSSTS